MLPIATDVAWSVCPFFSACMHVGHIGKLCNDGTVGREGGQRNHVLDGGPDHPQAKGQFGERCCLMLALL